MDDLPLSAGDAYADFSDPQNNFASYYTMSPWPVPLDPASHHHQQHHHPNSLPDDATLSATAASQSHPQHHHHPHLPPQSFDSYHLNASRPLMANGWYQTASHPQQQHHLPQQQQQQHPPPPPEQPPNLLHGGYMDPHTQHMDAQFPVQLQPSAMAYMPPHTTLQNTLPPQYTTTMDYQPNPLATYPRDLQNGLIGYPIAQPQSFAAQHPFGQAGLLGTSPSDQADNLSSSSSESGWLIVDGQPSRQSFESQYSQQSISNPGLTLHGHHHHHHHRADSNSSHELPGSAPSVHSLDSFELVHTDDDALACFSQHQPISTQAQDGSLRISPASSPTSSSSTSPISPSATSPTTARPKKHRGAVAKTTAKPASTVKVSGPVKPKAGQAANEKRVGRRRGPLRPEQRIQAGEIRKLRACLRCKFLKKTCDKGDPCAGCQPSHARLWQVPCTRIDIKDIGYFVKDWKADYERHVTMQFSIANIRGYSPLERTLYISHGFGFALPIQAREVFVRDEDCFNVDWIETNAETPKDFEITTARLTAGIDGVSMQLLSDYLDRHIDEGFEQFVDKQFEGTLFLTEMLKTTFGYYQRTQLPVIRKALKLILAYNLTQHITLVEGLDEDEAQIGRIDDENSKYYNQTLAPVMISFQVKNALAMMWRELQKDVLEELSALFASVYSGEKLKNWSTICVLVFILLAVWEEIQFDSHYRQPDCENVKKFCQEMENIPVGVIVGLFQAISQKLPTFQEWDTQKHRHLLYSNEAVCDAMTEIREHVNKYEEYLKSRSECKFDRNDFDSLSNKFTSKLVIRAH